MRYVVGLLITLGLVIILIILLMSGGRKSGPAQPKALIDYATTDAQVSVTIDGPVNADSEHEQIVITVDSANVTYEHIKGYQGDVVQTKLFVNNEDAYDAFLHALQHAGFSNGLNDPALEDEQGICALGDRYVFELTQDSKTLQRYWNTSCNNTKTYLGDTSLTLDLFQAQVPGYNELTADIQL